jgi:hypothetical protein
VPLKRDIGPPPAYLSAVPNPQPRPGQSVAVHAVARGAALDKANAIITCADAEWRATRMTLLLRERPIDAAGQGTCPALERLPRSVRRPRARR